MVYDSIPFVHMTKQTKPTKKTARTTSQPKAPTSFYCLANIDRETETYHATLESAMAAGDRLLSDARLPWKHHPTNFCSRSDEGWNKNDGSTYLAIYILTLNP